MSQTNAKNAPPSARTRTIALLILLVATAVASATPGPVSAAPDDDVQASNASISVSNFQFTPSSVSIVSGDGVTWTWTSGTHNVRSSGDGTTWCSTRSSGSCSKTFPTDGSFNFFCGIHPSLMTGTVNVGTPPTISITSPSEGALVDGLVTVTGTASHSGGVTKVEVKLGGQAYETAFGTTSWSHTIDVSALANGPRTITAKVTASNGFTSTDAVGIVIDNPPVYDLELWALTSTQTITGQPLVRAFYANHGNTAVTTTITLEYQYKGQWHLIAEHVDTVVAFDEHEFFAYDWRTLTLVGRFDIRATIDIDDLIDESDEGNNRLFATATKLAPVAGTDVSDP